MTLPSSGTITLLDLQNEFGGSNPIGLSEYYRGGAYVPNTSTNSGVPTSGTISLSDFYGAAALSNFSTTVTTGSGTLQQTFTHLTNTSQYSVSITTSTITGYGYDGGADFYSHSPNFGSIATATYSDAGSNSRTITSTYYASNNYVYFTLSGSSIPNTDTTFKGLIIAGGTELVRTSATYYSNTPSGASTWRWSTSTNGFSTSGTHSFEVVLV